MHKLYLTGQEVSVIQGAEEIVREYGGFPSMENGRLLSLEVTADIRLYGRYAVSLVYDIKGWHKASSLYFDLPKLNRRFIRMYFQGVWSVQVNSPDMRDGCSEIKFGNSFDRKEMWRDQDPRRVEEIERPFCVFFDARDKNIILEFAEGECEIRADFLDGQDELTDCI